MIPGTVLHNVCLAGAGTDAPPVDVEAAGR